MQRSTVLRALRTAAVLAIFSAGFLCGSLTQRNADAQFDNLGSDLLKRAEGSGGLIGNVAKLGTTINELETHVSGLQKNIDTLKAVKAALGGGAKK